jgi:hypothetical protein
MAMSPKSVALKATAVAAAALGATQMTAPAAHASAIGGVFLYSQGAGVNANCGTRNGTYYISNKGNVNLGYYYIYNANYLYTSYNGYFQTSHYEDWAANVADKQYWCVNHDFRYRYYAANAFHRYVSYYFYCTNIGCAYYGDHVGSWIRGV